MFRQTISRRGFVSALLTAAACPALPGARGAQPPYWKTAVGLNGFQSGAAKYGKSYAIRDVLSFAAAEGFDGIELVADWPSGPYPGAGEAEKTRQLRALYDEFKLRIFSIQLGAEGAFAPDVEAREAWLAQVRDRIVLAKGLGCACVGLWPGGGLRGQTVDEALHRLTSSLRQAARIGQEEGILLAFEIEPPFVFNTEAHVRRILDDTNHPNLKTIYDPSHYDLMSGSTGRPHEMLQRIGVDKIGYIHLTDTDGTLRDGGTSKHLACGDGHASIPESLKTLREGGFRGWIMIDAWEVPDPYDACRKGLRMIREAMKA